MTRRKFDADHFQPRCMRCFIFLHGTGNGTWTSKPVVHSQWTPFIRSGYIDRTSYIDTYRWIHVKIRACKYTCFCIYVNIPLRPTLHLNHVRHIGTHSIDSNESNTCFLEMIVFATQSEFQTSKSPICFQRCLLLCIFSCILSFYEILWLLFFTWKHGGVHITPQIDPAPGQAQTYHRLPAAARVEVANCTFSHF